MGVPLTGQALDTAFPDQSDSPPPTDRRDPPRRAVTHPDLGLLRLPYRWRAGSVGNCIVVPAARHDHCIKHQAAWTYQMLPNGDHQ